MTATPRLSIAIAQIDATRRYTHLVLGHVPHDRWFEMPAGAVSHVGWQVGHIAVSQAGHALRTVCGLATADLVPTEYGGLFGKGSIPRPDASLYPGPAELMQVLDTIHDRVLAELPRLAEAVMDEPASHATGLIHDKFDLLMWVARHEMLHVGQIGLIRRLMGLPPYR
jgi:hypothetical protein